ncbi:hypothetical protein L3X38_026747 [Prunus dulcis]|uniref:Uncharacterized protein n=1 Tax=Prunus dulcis TaxID=3755 RepID=A0AAD4YZL7_PRUDU|nr:hypothetical protein L3X38_026747 [Prunus dulcis]
MKRPFFKVPINDSHPYQVVKISAQLPPQIRVDMINFLCENVEVFKGSYESMPGIDPEIISHRRSIDPTVNAELMMQNGTLP